MINTTTLKAGDRITRISNGGGLFTVGKSYLLLDTEDGLSISHDLDVIIPLHTTCNAYWEKIVKATPTLKHIPMLLSFLNQHSIVAWFDYDRAVISCEAVYYDTVKKEGFTVLEEVQPSLRSVREWLGY